MSKFRTAIKHKAGTEVVINGHVIKLDPDAEGYCEFEVPDERDDVFTRLKEIPEGFELIADNGGEAKASQTVTVDGESVDLSTLDHSNLVALAKHIGLTPHHKTGTEKLIAAIVEKLAE